MNTEQLAAAKVGDNVTLTSGPRTSKGRVTQSTPKWFMITWEGGEPEIVRRQSSEFTRRLHLDTAPVQRAEPGRDLFGFKINGT